MRIDLQDWTPYQDSLYWEVHDRYFRSRGLHAWTEGEMPQFGSSNFGSARQCAELLLALAGRTGLEDEEPFVVLEVGGGTGTFAVNVFDALEHDLGPEGRAFAGRLRYLWSDYAENTVRQAIAQPAMAALIEQGRLEPRLYDLRDPGGLATLDGAPANDRAHLVLANYLVCVLPTRYLQRLDATWRELWVQVYLDVEWKIVGGGEPDAADIEELKNRWLASAEGDGVMRTLQCDQEWRPLGDGDQFASRGHLPVLDSLHGAATQTTVAYPYGFLDFLGFLGAGKGPLVDGGHVLVADYGHSEAEELHLATDRSSQIFGNSIAHGVNFGCLRAWAERRGWGWTASADPTRSVHVGLMRAGEAVTEPIRRVFDQVEVARTDGEDLLDFWAAARRARDADSPREALRMFLRCVALDPRNPSLRYEVAVSAIDGGFPRLAKEHLEIGQMRDVDGLLDWEFERGRAATELGDEASAAEWFTASLAREDHPTTWCNLAVVRQALGQGEAAVEAARKALALKADYPRAMEVLEALGAAP